LDKLEPANKSGPPVESVVFDQQDEGKTGNFLPDDFVLADELEKQKDNPDENVQKQLEANEEIEYMLSHMSKPIIVQRHLMAQI
jgi:hypothetical protein